MTTTFAPEPGPIVGYAGDDLLGGRSRLFADAEAAAAFVAQLNARGDTLPGCEDAASALTYGAVTIPVYADEGPRLNVSNTNAATLFAALGLITVAVNADGHGVTITTAAYEEGGEDATTFLGRTLLALALSPIDAGTPAYESRQSVRLIDCGRPAGYTDAKLRELEQIARWAIEHDRQVTWC